MVHVGTWKQNGRMMDKRELRRKYVSHYNLMHVVPCVVTLQGTKTQKVTQGQGMERLFNGSMEAR